MRSYVRDEAFEIVKKVLRERGENLDPYTMSRTVDLIANYIAEPFSIRTLSQEPYWVFLKAFARRTVHEVWMFIWNYIVMV